MATEIAHNLIGDHSIPIRIKSTSVWTVNDMYAKENTRGRVFCMGDAVHRHPPSNGLGSNTSIQDAYNLAWKIAFVLKGHAAPSLLESYDAERSPIAKQIVTRANQSIREFGPIFEALGLLSTTDPEEMKANMAKLKDSGEAAGAQRAALRKAIDFKSYEFNCHGVELNQRYKSKAVIGDGTPEPNFSRDKELYYHATSWPGARLPHVWLNKGTDRISSLDLTGKGRFALITGIGGEAWVEATKAISAETGVPIAAFVIGPDREVEDIFGDWAKAREIDEAGCILVRPDMHVAFRHAGKPKDAKALLSSALDQILGKHAKASEVQQLETIGTNADW
jgi:2,4-dichlorophenol 6-monooxygenase